MNRRHKILKKLLESEKPKLIRGKYFKREQVNDEVLEFLKEDFLFQNKPVPEGEFKGKTLGVLLDEELSYVYIVLLSEEVLELLGTNYGLH